MFSYIYIYIFVYLDIANLLILTTFIHIMFFRWYVGAFCGRPKKKKKREREREREREKRMSHELYAVPD